MPIKVQGIVVHSMSQYLKLPEGPMKASDFIKSIGLSVHGYIHPDGSYEKHISSPGKAFHAGKSKHEGLKNLNSHYLGFELLVPGVHDYASFREAIETPCTFTDAQFETAVRICKYWMDKYNIPATRVVRHSDVSGDGVRGKGRGKRDPGQAFLWQKFQDAIA